MPKIRIKSLIHDQFSIAAKKHIDNGDLPMYTCNNVYIFKIINKEEYDSMIIDTGKVMMTELGIEAELDTNYKS